MSGDTARIAAQDQTLAEVRDLVALVHEHRTTQGCDPHCPGLPAVLDLVDRTPGDRLNLLTAALMRIDDLQTGVADAIGAVRRETP